MLSIKTYINEPVSLKEVRGRFKVKSNFYTIKVTIKINLIKTIVLCYRSKTL